jgi:hypothetical protein
MDRVLITTTAIGILLIVSGDAGAYGSLRCNGRLIDVGDSTAQVLSLCGEPSTRVKSQSPVRAGNVNGFTRFVGYSNSEQWVYDRGWGKFPAVLFFNDGVLRRVEHLSRRSGDR